MWAGVICAALALLERDRGRGFPPSHFTFSLSLCLDHRQEMVAIVEQVDKDHTSVMEGEICVSFPHHGSHQAGPAHILLYSYIRGTKSLLLRISLSQQQNFKPS
jgi:hypothetical protein